MQKNSYLILIIALFNGIIFSSQSPYASSIDSYETPLNPYLYSHEYDLSPPDEEEEEIASRKQQTEQLRKRQLSSRPELSSGFSYYQPTSLAEKNPRIGEIESNWNALKKFGSLVSGKVAQKVKSAANQYQELQEKAEQRRLAAEQRRMEAEQQRIENEIKIEERRRKYEAEILRIQNEHQWNVWKNNAMIAALSFGAVGLTVLSEYIKEKDRTMKTRKQRRTVRSNQ